LPSQKPTNNISSALTEHTGGYSIRMVRRLYSAVFFLVFLVIRVVSLNYWIQGKGDHHAGNVFQICVSAKCGSTSTTDMMKKAFNGSNSVTSNRLHKTDIMPYHLPPSITSRKDLNVTSFIIYRDPISRLISTYWNKVACRNDDLDPVGQRKQVSGEHDNQIASMAASAGVKVPTDKCWTFLEFANILSLTFKRQKRSSVSTVNRHILPQDIVCPLPFFARGKNGQNEFHYNPDSLKSNTSYSLYVGGIGDISALLPKIDFSIYDMNNIRMPHKNSFSRQSKKWLPSNEAITILCRVTMQEYENIEMVQPSICSV